MLRLAAFLVLAAALLTAQVPAPTTGSFDFRVTTNTGSPVTGASATARGTDGKTYSGVTGADGHFRVAALPSGVYSFVAFDVPGYRRVGRDFLEDFSIHAGHTREVVFSTLELIGRIEGTVTDDAGNPIEGATVLALERGLMRMGQTRISVTATTDAQGHYGLSPRAEPSSFLGVYEVFSSGPTVKVYVPRERALSTGQAYFPDSADSALGSRPANQRRITFETLDLSLRRTPTFHIRGRVTGSPASAEASIVWISDCKVPAEETLATNTPLRADGSFDAAGILPGYYCVRFEMTERSTQRRRVSLTQTVTVSDRDIDQVELALPLPQL